MIAQEDETKHIGPVIALDNKISQQRLLSFIDALIERKSLKPSDKLVWEYIYTAQTFCAEYVENAVTYIRFFNACDLVHGQPNPDTKSKRPISLSRPNRYQRFKKYASVGLLIEHSHDIQSYKSTKVSVFKPAFPKLAPLVDADDALYDIQKIHKKTGITIDPDANIVPGKALERPGSIPSLANFIGRAVRSSEQIKDKTIVTKFTVKPEHKNKADGSLTVVATSLDNSELMLPEDNLIVDYIYSKLKETLLETQDNVTTNIRNRFMFDLAAMSRDLYGDDSGGLRERIYKHMLRISSSEFKVDASPNARYVMTQIGLVDVNGAPFDQITFNWFKILGEKAEYESSEAEYRSLKEAIPSRYVTISLPPFIHERFNDSLGAKAKELMLPMYGRSNELIKQPNAGTVWSLNNYLSRMLVEAGRKTSPVELGTFLERWYPALSNTGKDITEHRKIMRNEIFNFLKVMMKPERLLFYKNYKSDNARGRPRVDLLYAKVNHYIIRIENLTPTMMKYTSIKYSVTALRMDAKELEYTTNWNQHIRKMPGLAEDDMFLSTFALNLAI